ncbi:hypothetical protein [Erythrobacter aureus]|uniref:hypothetical protein n=1 Tax=Erythrobacter aureus TaxID=2182384 RepID=UPI003A94EF2F
MDHWRSQQSALIAALVIEAEIDSRRFHSLKDLTKKYGISLNLLDYNSILRQSWPKRLVEHPSIIRKDEYRIAAGMLESAKAKVLENFSGHFLMLDPAAHKVVTDSKLDEKIRLPEPWVFGGIDSDVSSAADWSQIDEMMAKLDTSRHKVIEVDRADPKFERAVQSLETLSTTLSQSNSASHFLKDEIQPVIRAGTEILRRSNTLTIGLVKFLILDRLREAYVNASEEFLKDLIKFSFFAVALYFLGIIG